MLTRSQVHSDNCKISDLQLFLAELCVQDMKPRLKYNNNTFVIVNNDFLSLVRRCADDLHFVNRIHGIWIFELGLFYVYDMCL